MLTGIIAIIFYQRILRCYITYQIQILLLYGLEENTKSPKDWTQIEINCFSVIPKLMGCLIPRGKAGVLFLKDVNYR